MKQIIYHVDHELPPAITLKGSGIKMNRKTQDNFHSLSWMKSRTIAFKTSY
jgi:hypothetical protein